MKVNFFCFLVLEQFTYIICENIFSSTTAIQSLVAKETDTLKKLDELITLEETRLNELKKLREKLKEENTEVTREVETYVSHPVNAYLLIERFSSQWKILKEKLKAPSTDALNDLCGASNLPTDEDIRGAKNALLRLQKFYQISSKQMAKGNIPGYKRSIRKQLSIEHFWILGKHASNVQDWELSKQWLQLVLEGIGEGLEVGGIKKTYVMDKLAFAEYKLGNFERALDIGKKLVQLAPEIPNYQVNVKNFKSWTKASAKIVENFLGNPTPKLQQRYMRLCRGEIRKQTTEEIKEMKCWLESSNPILKYKPQKMEMVWTNPNILLLRDVIFEKDIQRLKNLTTLKLKRAGLLGKNSSDDKRTSNNAFLSISSHTFIQQMARRVGAITSLNMKSAEQLQVGNYGIGGHYDVHFDYDDTNKNPFPHVGLGNRIATILYYLSDVDAGGATAFTSTETTVFPSKGDAVFWMNLKRSGKGDPMTAHAGCPVLLGNKWVANWWIHENGQEFCKPCLLDPQL